MLISLGLSSNCLRSDARSSVTVERSNQQPYNTIHCTEKNNMQTRNTLQTFVINEKCKQIRAIFQLLQRS